MSKRTRHGVFVAGDGYVMWWDVRRLNRPDQRIEYFTARGEPKSVTSGTIDEADLERAIKKFRREHSGQGVLL